MNDKRNAIVGREESEDSSNYIKLIPSVTSSINVIDKICSVVISFLNLNKYT